MNTKRNPKLQVFFPPEAKEALRLHAEDRFTDISGLVRQVLLEAGLLTHPKQQKKQDQPQPTI